MTIIIRPTDVETTGKETTDEVIEIGCYDIGDVLSVAPTLSNGRRTFVRPARPIPPSASAIHHIVDADVADAPVWADTWGMLVETEIGDDGEELKFAAHMASYERQYLDPLIKAGWICTWKCSLRQWPEFESHSLQAIRYALRLQVDHALAMPPHRALPDAYVCGHVVIELLKHQSIETLVAWSNEPAVFTKFNFGQFDGKPLSAADDGYLDWILNKADKMSDDWRWNAKHEIARRAAAAKGKYVDAALAAVPKSITVQDLGNWWFGQADEWAKHGIIAGTDQYEAIKAACSAHKAQLLAGEQPQFGGVPA